MTTALASYPRSGNTWVRRLIEHATRRPTASIAYDHPGWNIPVSGSPIITKTHRCDTKLYTRAVVLVRNPYDAIVSYFEYRKHFDGLKDLVWEDHVYSGIHGWTRHAEAWAAFGDKLRIRYEDMLGDTYAVVCKVLGYLGCAIDPPRIHAAVDACQASEMRKGMGADFMPMSTSGYGRDKFKEEERSALEKIAGPSMLKFGYSV